jgi:hypothetical protein
LVAGNCGKLFVSRVEKCEAIHLATSRWSCGALCWCARM